jgi:transposase InsO family protein
MACRFLVRFLQLETSRNVGDGAPEGGADGVGGGDLHRLRRYLRLRRVHAELGRRRISAGLELVRSIMRDQGLVPCQPRPWRASLTENDGSAGSIPDLVNRDFTADAPGEKMVGDITYIPTWEGWLYLATVIDCHTKKVVGYAMDDNYKTPLIIEAVRMAARNLTFAHDAIFHSDRAVTTPRPASPRPSSNMGSGSQSVEPGYVMITLWPNRSLPR